MATSKSEAKLGLSFCKARKWWLLLLLHGVVLLSNVSNGSEVTPQHRVRRQTQVYPRTFCRLKKNGQYYADPDNCRSYILCHQGRFHRATCAQGMFYNPEQQKCVFGDCDDTQISSRSASLMPNFHKRNFFPPEMSPGLMESIPGAINNAMMSLMDRLQYETNLASQQTGSRRPFRLVQLFLKAKPLAKQISMSAFVLNNAASELLDRFGSTTQDGLIVSGSALAPLPPNMKQCRQDELFPQPEPGICPWPMYNCETDVPFRSFDGSCNNLVNPDNGKSFTPFKRYLHPAYHDGLSTFRRSVIGDQELPSARLVSRTVAEDRNVPYHIQTTMLMLWGQFTDHDLTLTPVSKIATEPTGYGDTADMECGADGCDTSAEACKPIWVPPGDPAFSSRRCLQFVRSQEVPNINCTMGPREQLNQLTAYIDASNVYGSTADEALNLRDPNGGGRLKITPHPFEPTLKALLPRNPNDEACQGFVDSQRQCFRAGDERVNEQAGLTMIHTMFAREHNRIAEELSQINPHWDDSKIFLTTRHIIGAIMQHITYGEFLPTILGPDLMSEYSLELLEDGHFRGYNSSVNAGIANVFATAAFRFGHSLIPGTIKRANKDYNKFFYTSVNLNETFFRPFSIYNINEGGLDAYARGYCSQKTQKFDRHVTDQVTKTLFSEMGIGTDLVSLNTQRGRDHGLPAYNVWRQWCGLPRAHTFDGLSDTMSDENIGKLREVYSHVDDIDLFIGGISEKPKSGGLLGPTFGCILGRQFKDLKVGDRYWHENDGVNRFSNEQLKEIRKITLGKVICTNGDMIDTIQPMVMQLPFREAYDRDYSLFNDKSSLSKKWFDSLWRKNFNKRVRCSSLPQIDLMRWKDLTN